MKKAEAALLKEMCMQREVKRAKRTKILPNSFEILQIDNLNDTSPYMAKSTTIELSNETEADLQSFTGQVVIQDRLSAIRQALSEHTREGTRRKEPGRHSFHVDASVSWDENMTGIAVVHKAHRQDWASPWTARGYRIHDRLSQVDAEAWAIWQALQVILDKVGNDRLYVMPQDPCSIALVYSDCWSALDRIRTDRSDHGFVTRKIISQSVELEKLGVELQLHWVPGHRNIPGNELADIVSKMARRPAG